MVANSETVLSARLECPSVLLKSSGVYIRWNGMLEWNSGMDYWNGGMFHRTYLIIQHVLYSEQYPIIGNIRVCRGCRQKYSKP